MRFQKAENFSQIQTPAKEEFLHAFAAMGIVGKAAEAPDIDPDYHYIAGSGVMKPMLTPLHKPARLPATEPRMRSSGVAIKALIILSY